MKFLIIFTALAMTSMQAMAADLQCSEFDSGKVTSAKTFALNSNHLSFVGSSFQVDLFVAKGEILEVVTRDINTGVEFTNNLQGMHSSTFGMSLRDASYKCEIK